MANNNIIDFSKISDSHPKNSEIKLAEGVYFTDFRQNIPVANAQNIYLNQQNKEQTFKINENIQIQIADYNEFGSKIKQMDYSIKEIQKIENWQSDLEFLEAIHENYSIILKYLEYQMLILNHMEQQDKLNPFLKENSTTKVQQQIDSFRNNFTEFLKSQYQTNHQESEKPGIYL